MVIITFPISVSSSILIYHALTFGGQSFTIAWRKYKDLAPVLTTWTLTACDVLARNSNVESDCVLSTLVRLSNVVGDASSAIHEPQGQTEQQRRLIMLGLESQAAAVQQQVPPNIASWSKYFHSHGYRSTVWPLSPFNRADTWEGPVKILSLFIDVYIAGGSLTLVPRPRNPSASNTLLPRPARLVASVTTLRSLLDHFSQLDPTTGFSSFTAADWGRLTLCIVLAFRLSFKVPECPQFNHIPARHELGLGDFLDGMCAEADLVSANKQVDVFSATRVVLKVVKLKFDRRLELALANEAAESLSGQDDDQVMRIPASVGCPMLDGSLEHFFPIWDPSLPDTNLTPMPPPPPVSGHSSTAPRPVFHDLWATMTMGWANEEDGGETS